MIVNPPVGPLSTHWENVYGPTGDWHLTCLCGQPIYPGEGALITEDAEGDYVQAVGTCCVPRT